MQTSEEIKEIALSLVEVQEEMVAIKDADNPFFKSKYAPLDEILKSIRPALKKAGLTVIQSMRTEGKDVTCVTRILHKSGEWMDSEMTLTADKPTPQGFGSAATYARRYGICAALSISTPNEDDDGNRAETDAEKAKDKSKKEATAKKYAEKLDAHKEMWRDGLLALDVVAVHEAFESSGFTTEKDDPAEALDDLLSQVDTLTKLKNIKELAKKRHVEVEKSIEAAEKEQDKANA